MKGNAREYACVLFTKLKKGLYYFAIVATAIEILTAKIGVLARDD